jgi:hypothetical protein
MHSTCGGHEIEEQEENAHLQNVYSLGELQDYICHTTVPAANHNNSMVSHGRCCANSYPSFSALSWSMNSTCSTSIQRTDIEAHNFHLSQQQQQQQQHMVVTSPITTTQLLNSSSSLEAAAIMVCVGPSHLFWRFMFFLCLVSIFHSS